MMAHPPNRGGNEVGLVKFADGLKVVDRIEDGLVPVPVPACTQRSREEKKRKRSCAHSVS